MATSRSSWTSALVVGVLCAMGCGSHSAASSAGVAAARADSSPLPRVSGDSAGGCPATGVWAMCSVVGRLKDAGLNVKVDSAPRQHKGIAGDGTLLHIGRMDLELFLFADTAARHRAEHGLAPSTYIELSSEPKAENQATIIRAFNALGLLYKADDTQRERIWDALMAGPPQPHRPH